MKKVELLEVRLDDLGNVSTTVGAENVFCGMHYRVFHVTAPPGRSPQRRKNKAARSELWRVLVRTLT